MAVRLLLDTDILIDYLRDRAERVAYLESLTDETLVSAASVAELFAGVREGNERTALDEFLRNFTIIPIDQAVATLGDLYRRDYGKAHSTGLVDALIAATAELHNATLVTLNMKHFPMLTDVIVPYQKS